jgi:hypothetical protein
MNIRTSGVQAGRKIREMRRMASPKLRCHYSSFSFSAKANPTKGDCCGATNEFDFLQQVFLPELSMAGC